MSKKKRPFSQSHTRKLRDTRIEGEPGYERKLASEIIKRWNAYNPAKTASQSTLTAGIFQAYTESEAKTKSSR